MIMIIPTMATSKQEDVQGHREHLALLDRIHHEAHGRGHTPERHRSILATTQRNSQQWMQTALLILSHSLK